MAGRFPRHRSSSASGRRLAAAARAAGLDNVREARDASAQGIVDELIEALGPGADDGP